MHITRQAIKWSINGLSVMLPTILCALLNLLTLCGVAQGFEEVIGDLVPFVFPTALIACTWLIMTTPIPPRRRVMLLLLAWGAILAQLFLLAGLPPRASIYAI